MKKFTEILKEAKNKITFKKDNSADGKKFENIFVYVDDLKLGTIGYHTTKKKLVTFYSKSEEGQQWSGDRFKSIEDAKKFFKSIK